jgi:ABC-type sugar transport system ATPase subunit
MLLGENGKTWNQFMPINNANNLYLEVKDLKKNFKHIEALRGANLKAYSGQVLAIVGDNGAGKSTLIKALSGVLKPDQGEMIINGVAYAHLTPKLAGECGISTVYQDLALVNTQNVWENIFLGHEYRKLGWLNQKKMRKEAFDLIESLGIAIEDHDTVVGNMSGGQRQAVAVARALRQGGKLFIFDEPTAAMGYKETIAVQQLIESLRQRGFGVIIISHNIQQVYKLADCICVMRQGMVVDTVDKNSVTTDDIVTMIVSGAPLNGELK